MVRLELRKSRLCQLSVHGDSVKKGQFTWLEQ